jgi:hypothetical protein
MACTSKCSLSLNVPDLADSHSSRFESEPFNHFLSLFEWFRYQNHPYFHYDMFGKSICDSPNIVSPWHQYNCDSAKDGMMLEIDSSGFGMLDQVPRLWWLLWGMGRQLCHRVWWRHRIIQGSVVRITWLVYFYYLFHDEQLCCNVVGSIVN